MRAAIITSPGIIRLDEMSGPTPGPGEVLVRTLARGLCTTDLDILEGQSWGLYPNIPHGRRDMCRSGLPRLCGSLCAVGATQGGGFELPLVPGSHRAMRRDPHLRTLVRELEDVIREARQRAGTAARKKEWQP